MVRKNKKKPSYHNPWHFHTANNETAARRIAKSLSKSGKDVRVKRHTKKRGKFTVWERN